MPAGRLRAPKATFGSRLWNMSTCCEEPSLVNLMNGPAPARVMRQAGYPGLLENGDAFWQPVSFRRNASSMKTPILMQLADREYLGALEGYGTVPAFDCSGYRPPPD